MDGKNEINEVNMETHYLLQHFHKYIRVLNANKDFLSEKEIKKLNALNLKMDLFGPDYRPLNKTYEFYKELYNIVLKAGGCLVDC